MARYGDCGGPVWCELTWRQLSKIFTQLTLPPFPPKKFWNVTDPDFVQRRRQELQHYCNEIMGIKPVASSDALQYFLHNGLE